MMQEAGGLNPGDVITDLMTTSGSILQTATSVNNSIVIACTQLVAGNVKPAYESLLAAQALLTLIESDIKYMKDTYDRVRAAGQRVKEENRLLDSLSLSPGKHNA